MKIYFIGAGPGDPQLLTIKAQGILKRADIIIYAGSLVSKEILKWRKKESRVYNSAQMSLEQIQRVFSRAKQRGQKIVARIHTGDPSIYGAIQEQMNWCDEQQINYQVIPGVSSFCAAAALLRQELTLPGISQSVIISRVSGRTKVPRKEDLEKLARIRATLVLFLSIDKIEKVVKKLITGYSKNTPIAVVSRVSWPDQKVIYGTLASISQKVNESGIRRQALIFVGDVLNKQNFKKSKLYNQSFSHMFRQAK